MRMIDLSSPISERAAAPTKVHIRRIDHRKGARLLALEAVIVEPGIWNKFKNLLWFLSGIRRLRPENFPDGMGLAWESVSMLSHRGTHMDAPWHFGGAGPDGAAKTIEKIPLEWCFGDGLLLDFTWKKPGEFITRQDIVVELSRIQYRIKPGDIVLIKTGCERYWDHPEYLTDYPGLEKDALYFLLDQGVKIIGIDSYSLDRPSYVMVKEYFEKGRDSEALWPTHFAGRIKEYCHIEQLANLDKLPKPYGFKVCCFPVLIEEGSAGWCRVVVMLQE